MSNSAAARGRGRPPTKDISKMAEYYGGLNRIPADKLAAAQAAQSAMPVIRQAPRTGSVTPITVVRKDDPTESDDVILARIKDRFAIMNDFTQAALDGDLTSMVVSGAPGVGKSHNIKRKLLHAREQGRKVEFVTGGNITPINVYKLFYRNQQPDNVVLFDDADSIWDDDLSLGILKGALDSVPERQISWFTESPALKAEDIPQTFMFRGSVIFISNIDFQTQIDTTNRANNKHLAAVMNRTQYLDLKLHTPRELAIWIEHVVTTTHMLVAEGLTREQERDVVRYIRDNRDNMRDLSLRTAIKCVTYVKRAGADWKNLAEKFILR
jgi:hypothetical protein